ncbi:MAG: TetR/AcrR family transcriptional regulator [Pyramidobacter sp.]|nr:TetR/AcrR family transcriptional regulator [Pyramidobacter sp.]
MPRLSAQNKILLQTATRDRAFECACSLMREEGWQNFTMEKLAARMGVSKGTIYNYFTSKQDVLLFIREREIQGILCGIERVAERETDVLVQLRIIIVEMLERMREFRFLHFAMGELLFKNGGESAIEFLKKDPLKPAREMLSRILERGMEQGCIRRCDPVIAGALLHSLIAGVDMGSHFDIGLDTGDRETLELISDHILFGFCAEEK